MDREQQIRLNFLEEADDYFEDMESHLLGLANNIVEPQKIDLVLRSAHSIKGGAAMMGFPILSQVAHRLEDFLKVLRVRYVGCEITTEVETLLLESIDCLRVIGDLNHQGVEANNSYVCNLAENETLGDHEEIRVAARYTLIFDQLQQHLGELEARDEDVLMTQNEGVEPALLIFEEGVDTVLDRFEAQLSELEGWELSQELAVTAQELIAFGKMANLEPFVQLSQAIAEKTQNLPAQELVPLANEALRTWRRSHALVLRGSLDKLPSALKEHNSINNTNISTNIELPILEDTENDSRQLSELKSAFELDTAQIQLELEQVEDNALELGELSSAFELDTTQIQLELEQIEDNALELGELPSTFELDTAQTQLELEQVEDNASELDELQSTFELDIKEKSLTNIKPESNKDFPQQTVPASKMAKVSLAQLKEFNNLFEQLILDRNAINLRLKQLQNVAFLMNQRIHQMESSNAQLKQWYDRASVEGFLSTSWEKRVCRIPQVQSLGNSVSKLNRDNISEDKLLSKNFDPLEMDRYDDIHLICQEQIETIVQLQEVGTDLELEIQEINQAIRNLNYTTQFMQGNVTSTQMLPFAEIVTRFPRVIRDLNLKFNKQVKLNILGDNTLLDRTFVKPLGDSLIHLLRNSFDHGIENRETRIAQGKDPSGTITIQASNQGTYTLITFSDDGCGISIDRICDRLSEMGIPSSQVRHISETELLDFIFEPGFTTTKEVSELSGRGMGMDIVRANVQEMNGDIQVSTELGKGTKFTLKIPFTLSILRVAIIEQEGIIFAIPADTIRELLPSLESTIIKPLEDTKYINWQGKEIPLLEIEKTLAYNHAHNNFTLTGSPAINQTTALIVGDEKSVAAIQISRFWQEQESTIRPIDSPIPLPPGVISSMVFGDGKVIPLIDPNLLIQECLKNSATNNQFIQLPRKSFSITRTKTILVVDDSINVRRYLSLTLEKARYQVEQAKDGQEAVEKLLAGLAVQGVICDLEMPRLNGYGVLEIIKDRPELEHIPIIILTSRSNEKHRKLAFNLGASAYFAKPYNEQELLDKLALLLS
ncbi:MAG: hybrid sensor histidine kinase/response regulator [Xenococcaceae cyanobacterium MO_188.B19]|nr:hybrid sensor histidine kinase/response regulator [Xenococcaceae cyanobacterium MO_188.B19]